MNLYSIASLSVVITCFLLALFILVYGKTKLHRIWTSLNVAVGIWALGSFFVSISPDKNTAWVSWKFSYVGVIFVASFFYHTVYYLCGLKHKKLLVLAYGQGFVFLFFDLFTNLLIGNLEYEFDSFFYHKAISHIP